MLIRKKLQQREGITLLELLIVIGLTGLIFSLGIYPMLSQLKLLNAQRAEISLFDEANLAVFYITKDAMRASRIDSSEAAVTLAMRGDPAPPNIAYMTQAGAGGTLQLLRSVFGVTYIITRKLDPTQVSGFWQSTINGERHHLGCDLYFRDPDNPNITTRRRFDVMLRCRDTYK